MKKLCLTLAVTAWLSAASLGQGFDAVVLHEGSPKRGNIVEMSKDSVGLDISGVVVPVEVGKIKRVTFADAPAQLTAAQTSLAEGQLEDAIEKLSKIDKGSIPRKIVEAEVDYYLALARAKLALAGAVSADETTKAVTDMMKFAQNTGSYHFYEANEVTGDLALVIGRADKAADFYAKVREAPWPEYKVKAAMLEGQAQLAGGKFADALKQFELVMGANLNTPLALQCKDLAAVGKAKCLAETGKPAEGIQEVEKIIADGDSRDGELFGRAYNALGLCQLKANNPKQALLSYLHVHLLFYQNPSQHAEALYHLRTLWREANEAGRALEASELLKQRYPNSVWNAKAAAG